MRVETVDGPVLDRLPAPRTSDARKIFMYIAKGNPVRMDIVEPLRPLAKNLRVFAPGLPPETIANLASAGAVVDQAPLSLVDVLPETRLLIHIAGHGVACEALIAGVPQLVLSVDIEKELYGRALEEAGVGRMVKAHYPEATLSTEVIATLAADEGIALRAAEIGVQHREFSRRANPAARFEKMALALLQLA
jgi:UDP:flavonoid glycosyltransferase YjiC (YdhE family)